MPSLSVNGVSLAYEERGEGDAVLLVHGSASDMRTWHRQMEDLGKHFRTIAYSRRYHWPNETIADNADYSMLEHTDDLRVVVQSLGEAPVHLIGHSYGGFVCLLLAMREPHLVKSLVLSEPPVLTLFTSSTPKPGEILSLLARRPRTAMAILKFGAFGVTPASAALRRGDFEAAIRSFARATLGRRAFNSLSGPRLEQVRANFIKAELLGSGFAPLDEDAVRSLDMPVLLLTSEKSPRMFHLLARRLEELLPDVRRAVIPSASHIMHEDNSEAYNAAVLSFLLGQELRQS